MNRTLRYFLFFILSSPLLPVRSQTPDFMLQGWYWDYPNIIDGKNYMWDLGLKADALKEAGFTYVWVPPLAKGSGGLYSMGYDVRDYYDIGEYGFARWGSAATYDTLLTHFNAVELNVVADVIYNHRDGGAWEDNVSVEGWIENMNLTKILNGDQPFPSDRFRCYLPLGGASGNGAGTYYFKIHSASGAAGFYNKPYTVIMWTNTVDADYGAAATDELEPNGGGDCGEANNSILLGKRKNATIDNGGCGTDEFALSINTSDFDAAGDTLWIRMYNTGGAGLGDMTDHFIYGLWSGAAAEDIQEQIHYQTATDFTNMPSGNGAMNNWNFKPNGNPTQLAGDLDAMYFYYDIDQSVPNTQDVLFDWTTWLWSDKGVRGYRMDAVKHFPAWFTGDLLDHLHDNGMDPGMVVGENYDYSPTVLKGWIDEVQNNMDDDTKANIHVRLFDFALRNNLEQACDLFGYDVRNLFNAGMVDGAGASGYNVVTFINNHDFRDGTQPVDNDPILAYAYILTNNKLGVPCVYYPDYYAPRNLQYKINGLMLAHSRYIYGATDVDYLTRFGTPYAEDFSGGSGNTTLVYQLRNGESGRDVIVAINFAGETLKLHQGLNMGNLSPGDTLTDIFTVTPTAYQLVSGDGKAYLEVPPRSFAVWVQGDLRNETISIEDPVTIESADALDLQVFPNPASDKLYITPGVIAASVDIYAMTGQKVFNNAAFSGEEITIHRLDAGMYILHIVSDTKTFTYSFIKQ